MAALDSLPALRTLALTIDDAGIARVRLTRPDEGNPINRRFFAELREAATVCELNAAVRCVLISAGGRYFSVGGDVRVLAEGTQTLQHFIRDGGSDFCVALSKLMRMRAPVVVAVHGMAVGGMVGVIAACDAVVAARSASFYAGYTALGLSPDGGATYMLPRIVGDRRARAFYLRNETWSAQRAFDYGLVTDLVDDEALDETSEALASELAAGPTAAFGELKNLLVSSSDASLETQLELELRATARTAATDDAERAVKAVAARERPAFRGR